MKLVGLLSCLFSLALAKGSYQFVEEWRLWKSEHNRWYSSEKEELERHSVWLANREYVLMHNVNKEVYGFSLSLNRFADMVGTREGADMVCRVADWLVGWLAGWLAS